MAAARLIALALALGGLLASAPALAQLPLPELAGPDVRLAGQDPLEDRLRSLSDRIETELETRRPVVVAAQRAAEGSNEETGPRPAVGRLALALERELALLEKARESAADGLALLDVQIPESISVGFAELVEATEGRERPRALAEQRDARARRLAALGAAPRVQTATTGEGARLEAEAVRIQAAEALATRAEALATRAEVRVATARVAAMRAGLEVTQDEVEAARARLDRALAERAKAEQELGRRRAQLAPELMGSAEDPREALRQRAANAQIELGVRAVANAEARASRAQVELAALQGLLEERSPVYSSEVTADALEARLAATREARVEAESRLSAAQAELRKEPPRREQRLLVRVRDALEDVLGSLAEESEALEAALELQRLLGQPLLLSPRSPDAMLRAILLTALVGLIATLLLLRGLPFLQRVESRLGKRVREAKGEPRSRRARWFDGAVNVLMITYPLFVVGGGAALIIWPIWQLPISFEEAVSAIDRPLFYVDEQAISVFSLAKLILTVWVTVVLSRVLRRFLVVRVFRKLSVNEGLVTTLNTFVHYSFLVVGLSIGLRFVGLGLSSFALLAGVLGIGIGFGLRNVTENFISGLIVLVERPIQVGDWIDVNGEVEGQVKGIRARSTTLVTRDNISIIIPNSEFVGRQVTNWSHGDPKVRLRIPVGVVYGSDTDLTRRTLLEVAERYGRVLDKPPPEVQFVGFGASSLDFLLLVWIDQQMHRFRIESDLRFAIDAAFRRKQIVIAFPQLDLHLKTVEARAASLLAGNAPPPSEKKGEIPEGPADKKKKVSKAKAKRTELGVSGGTEPASPAARRRAEAASASAGSAAEGEATQGSSPAAVGEATQGSSPAAEPSPEPERGSEGS